MAYEVPTALIGSISALFGAGAGVYGSLLVAKSQHKLDAEDALKTEGRQRSRDAASIIEGLVEQLARDIPDEHRDKGTEEQGRDRRQRIRENSERMSILIGDLPDRWRQRVGEGWDFLRWSDDVAFTAYPPFHYSSCSLIAHNAASDIRRVLGAFLRNESQPPGISRQWLEYRAAGKELLEYKEMEFAQEIAEEDDDRAKWLEQRPKLKAEIEASNLPVRVEDY